MVFHPHVERHTITLDWRGDHTGCLEDIPADYIVTRNERGNVLHINLERIYLGTLQMLREDVEKWIGADEVTRQENLMGEDLDEVEVA